MTAAPCRLLVTGASGSGTTTLGRALAQHWAVPHADSDDYYWLPTDPPYTSPRDASERVRLMEELFAPRAGWVLSGSIMGWGEPLAERIDAAIFLTVEPSVRLERLRARERRRYGDEIDAGGRRHLAFTEFLDWAAGYDDPNFAGRNRALHEAWLDWLDRPVLRLDSTDPLDLLLEQVDDWTTPPETSR